MKEKSLSDKLAIENVLSPLDDILMSKAQGEGLLENVLHRSEVVLPNTSDAGQQVIHTEVSNWKKNFSLFFDGTVSSFELRELFDCIFYEFFILLLQTSLIRKNRWKKL